MSKRIYIDRKTFKISPKKHIEMLKSDPISRKILEEEEKEFIEQTNQLKEGR